MDEPTGPARTMPPRRTDPRRLSLALALPLILVWLLVLGLGRDPRALPSPLEGEPAPEFTLREMTTGRQIRLSDLRGQVVVINFWASWCAGCQREHDDLAAAWQRYREHGVVLLGVVYQDTEENARIYTQVRGGDWPIALDPSSRTALDYGVVGIPETFFIGRDGQVAHKHVGEATYEMLLDWTERLLRAPVETGTAETGR